MNNHIQDFLATARSVGLCPDTTIKADGRIHRADLIDEKKGKKSGWYVLHLDGIPAGAAGNWKTGQSVNWCAKERDSMTDQERRDYQARIKATQAQREAEEAQLRAEAADRARAIWEAAQPAPADHPYLTTKGVKPHGLRLHRDLLAVPLRDSTGALQSLQFISPTGEKRFITGGRKRACYCTIGAKPTDRIYIAEGYATAATIHEATGEPVAVAFDAGNLEPVAKVMREKFPEIEIIIAADNDRFSTGNPGLTKAAAAAAAVQAQVVYPDFYPDQDGSDFNDYIAVAGPERLVERLEPQAMPTPIDAANDNNPVSTVNFYAPLPDVTEKGRPLSTIENLQEICRRLGVTIRYNVIKKDDEIIVPNATFSVDNNANASLAWLTSWVSRFKMPTGQLGQYVTFLGDQNLYNPAAQYVLSRPWDGVSRLADFYGTVTAKGRDQRLKEALMRRWMISAIAAAFRPHGVSAHGVLVLQGAQNLGKTWWFKNLVPEDTRLAQDGWTLRPDDRDNVKQACSHWLVELGELDATFRKSDIAALKSFLTRDRDILRRPYAQRESEFARRTVFFASVNPKEFLHDPTGNRRYWTIECESIIPNHGLDMQQVWAEFYQLYLQGESWVLQGEERDWLTASNADFEVVDPMEDRLRTRLNWEASETFWGWKTVTDTLISIGIERPDRVQLNSASTLIRRFNGERWRKSNGKKLMFTPPLYDKNSYEPF